jgi:hypothetical protein
MQLLDLRFSFLLPSADMDGWASGKLEEEASWTEHNGEDHPSRRHVVIYEICPTFETLVFFSKPTSRFPILDCNVSLARLVILPSQLNPSFEEDSLIKEW